MAEYIEREELINQIRLMVNRSSVGETSLNDISAKTICGLILEQPTADVAEVKHGEWISLGLDDNDMEAVKCSECNIKRFGRSLYCSHCGAKMDLKEGAD